LSAPTLVGGVRLKDGRELSCGAAVLTTGTFLRGLIHVGETQTPAGRIGEAPAIGLSATLQRLGFALRPAQNGDAAAARWHDDRLGGGRDAAGRRAAEPFSMLTERIETAQIECGITRTLPATHDIIRANVHRSPMYSGQIREPRPALLPLDRGQDRPLRRARWPPDFPRARGPRRHDGLSKREFSTSLPEDVQRALVATIPGLENAKNHPARLCDRVRPRGPARAQRDAGSKAPGRAVPGGPDQRHDRL